MNKMDGRFKQINKVLQEEIKKIEIPNRLRSGKLSKKRIGLFFAFGLTITVAFFYFLILFDRNASAKPEITIVKNIKKVATNLKASVSNSALNPLPSFLFSAPKNILLLGMPGPGNDAPELTDTIALIMIKPKPINAAKKDGVVDPITFSEKGDESSFEGAGLSQEVKVKLVSIPRDLWVKIPESENYSKINSLYALGKRAKNQDYGLRLIQQKVEEITGQKIDYYFLVDLSVVKELVDQQGGINLMVRKDIYDPSFPGPNHSYQTFEIKAGWRYLDGETAIKYIRTRHSPDGDFDRIERQQQVLEALKQKIINLNPIWDLPELFKIANEIYSKIKTNFPLSEIPQFWSIAKKVSPPDILNLIIEKENNLITSYPLLLDNQLVSALQPKAGLENYEEIRKFIEEN